MFDIGWSELLLIAAIAILVIGPKELPVVMRTLGRLMRRLQYVRYAFSKQFEDFMETQNLDELRESVNFEAKKNKFDFDESASDEEGDIIPEIEFKEDGDGKR
jgi:sec-independent protein translocase protein TatB